MKWACHQLASPSYSSVYEHTNPNKPIHFGICWRECLIFSSTIRCWYSMGVKNDSCCNRSSTMVADTFTVIVMIQPIIIASAQIIWTEPWNNLSSRWWACSCPIFWLQLDQRMHTSSMARVPHFWKPEFHSPNQRQMQNSRSTFQYNL